MLDLGFEKEMNQCLDLIKAKCPSKFETSDSPKPGKQTFYSDEILINFVSATMNQQVESLGQRLMRDYVKVGFGEKGEKASDADAAENEIDDMVASIPK